MPRGGGEAQNAINEIENEQKTEPFNNELTVNV